MTALVAVLWSSAPVDGARALEPNGSSSRLERPIVDLAVLPPAGDAPRLLVLDAETTSPDAAHLEAIERGRTWRTVGRAHLWLGSDGLDARWLIGLAPDRFALIATNGASPGSVDDAVIVALSVTDDGATVDIVETARRPLPQRAIDEAGAADIDGDGTFELLIRVRPVSDDARCDDAGVIVLDGSSLAEMGSFGVPRRRLAGGVIGAWDDVPGDDLLAYAYTTCPSASTPRDQTRLMAIRLADGSIIRDLEVDTRPGVPRLLGPPLRLDLDGNVPHEALARTIGGLSVLDPTSGWTATEVGGARDVGLVAGATGANASGVHRVAWLEVAGNEIVSTALVRRDAAGAVSIGDASTLGHEGDGRWQLVADAVAADIDRDAPSAAWIGDAFAPGCPDLIVPTAILPCGASELQPAAAWVATRPIMAIPVNGQRRLLIAAGVGWMPGRIPPTPAPWAAGPPGWWRHGPSAPFVLSEVRSGDVGYFRQFPVPRASIDTTTAADGTTALPGFTGSRLFVSAIALAGEAPPPADVADPALGLLGLAEPGAVSGVARIPVPAGLESGRDGSFAPYSLAAVDLPDGQPPERWSMMVVPINDWGEVGRPAVGTIARDAIPPTLGVDVPFLSPVWPFATTLSGVSEPGSVVEVDGQGPLTLDRRGRFSFEATLPPWPSTVRVTAIDDSGNRAVQELSLIGGIDYRRLPWALIGALIVLALVALRGLRTSSPRAADRPIELWLRESDEGGPVIEDLPPGGGLASG